MSRRRQIVVDTETTGLEFSQGDRIIEIGCIEMRNRRKSGDTLHHYLNPERDIDDAAVEVHGITPQMLKDKPKFKDIAEELLAFIKGAELIIHNAPFDVGFLNNEFELAGYAPRTVEVNCKITDSLQIARQEHPGQRNSLDALCQRYAVDNSQRTLHGALLDAEILLDVYLAMTGGQETLMSAGGDAHMKTAAPPLAPDRDAKIIRTPLIRASADEIKQHEQWLQLLAQESGREIEPEVDKEELDLRDTETRHELTMAKFQ